MKCSWIAESTSATAAEGLHVYIRIIRGEGGGPTGCCTSTARSRSLPNKTRNLTAQTVLLKCVSAVTEARRTDVRSQYHRATEGSQVAIKSQLSQLQPDIWQSLRQHSYCKKFSFLFSPPRCYVSPFVQLLLFRSLLCCALHARDAFRVAGLYFALLRFYGDFQWFLSRLTECCVWQWVRFYRAALCVSRKHGTSLSDTLVYSFKTAKDIIIYFSHSDSPIILVSEAQAPLPNSKWTPSAGR